MENQTFGSWHFEGTLPQEGAAFLPELSVIEVTGEDAVDFVHGQVTNHVQNIGNAFRMAAYCQPRGRILALMRIYRKDNALYLIMPREITAGFMKRFSMFILRSRVTLRLADELAVAGIINPEGALPEIDSIVVDGDVVIARVADTTTPRAMLIGPKEILKSRFCPTLDSAAWFASQIMAGIPCVGERTKEAFVPQWINMDVIGGVVFNKGCYPGQEIIARVQHIGTTPRRMVRLTAQTPVALAAGDDVFIESAPVGQIVMSVTTDTQTIALAQVTLEAHAAGRVRVGGSDFEVFALV